MKSDEGVRILPVFDGDRQTEQAKWEVILQLADSYDFAEHWNGDSGTFVHWPNSLYNATGTNSNTFVRVIPGSLMVEMQGGIASHPGAMVPTANPPPADYTFYDDELPFQGSAPPMPSYPPP